MAAAVVHPFTADPGDHAETPADAYGHIAHVLERLSRRLGTTPAALRIYDPYFCEGSMRRHLARLGFATVHNANEDCYAVQVWY